jgi:biofilm PGA synthesis N-glycosyltransferase PgaC
MLDHAPGPAQAGLRDRAGEYRALAGRPLPPLRRVADFVALPTGNRTLSVDAKFAIASGGAGAAFAVGLALAAVWGGPIAALVSWPSTLILFAVVVAAPAARASYRCLALLLDDPPPVQRVQPTTPVTVVLVAATDPAVTAASLATIADQDYLGPRRVVIVDPTPDDTRTHAVHRTAVALQLPLEILAGGSSGDPRNVGLAVLATPLVLPVQPGVRLHPSALRLLVARLESSAADTVAAASHTLIRNRGLATSAEVAASTITLELDTQTRIEALFGGPLTMPGACTLFRSDPLRAVNGWPSGAGNDTVVTGRLLERGWHTTYERLAVVFTDDDVRVGSWPRRRVRAARALHASRRDLGRARLADRRSRVLGRVDRAAPLFDVAFLLGWVQAIALLATGRAGLVVSYAVLAAPVTLAGWALGRRTQHETLDEAGLTTSEPARAWLGPLASLAAVQVPAGLWARAARPSR